MKCIGTHRRGPRRVREVVAGAGAHEGRVGRIWDGGGMLRRGRACLRAKAEGGIDEKGVRGCGDGERGDSEAEVGRGGSFVGVVSPTCTPQATSYAHTCAAPMVHPYAPHTFRPPTALPYAFHAPHAFSPRPSPTNPWPSPMHPRPFPTCPWPSPTHPNPCQCTLQPTSSLAHAPHSARSPACPSCTHATPTRTDT